MKKASPITSQYHRSIRRTQSHNCVLTCVDQLLDLAAFCWVHGFKLHHPLPVLLSFPSINHQQLFSDLLCHTSTELQVEFQLHFQLHFQVARTPGLLPFVPVPFNLSHYQNSTLPHALPPCLSNLSICAASQLHPCPAPKSYHCFCCERRRTSILPRSFIFSPRRLS
jgi:hypothetical protein